MWKTLALLICVQGKTLLLLPCGACAIFLSPSSLSLILTVCVAGGVDAPERAWPWMVSLHNPTCNFCGGSLISTEWEASIRVYLGKLTQRETNKKEVMINVQKIYTHHLYNATTRDNDIALLHLSSPVRPNDYISPVCLVAQNSDFPPSTPSWIIGWGKIADEENVPYPGTLQEAKVFVVDKNQCQNQLIKLLKKQNMLTTHAHLQITNNMICAGVPGGGVDAHCGDSGGPIMSQHCSKCVQFGITSWGIGCGRPDMSGVYTSVSQYQQWITDTIKKHPSQDLPQFVTLSLPLINTQHILIYSHNTLLLV
uniref:Si:ch73-182e20.4 n=1 Tax=Sinocyclocheilus anshuiensis TaxID=1608454 RepID=A0A671NRD6_9TELE